MKVKGIRDRCYYCAKQEKCTKDHFIPRSKGGTLTAWACKKCQTTKKDLMPLEWLKIIDTVSEYKGKEERIKNSVLSLLQWMNQQERNKMKYKKFNKGYSKRWIPKFVYHNTRNPNFAYRGISFHWLDFYYTIEV